MPYQHNGNMPPPPPTTPSPLPLESPLLLKDNNNISDPTKPLMAMAMPHELEAVSVPPAPTHGRFLGHPYWLEVEPLQLQAQYHHHHQLHHVASTHHVNPMGFHGGGGGGSGSGSGSSTPPQHVLSHNAAASDASDHVNLDLTLRL